MCSSDLDGLLFGDLSLTLFLQTVPARCCFFARGLGQFSIDALKGRAGVSFRCSAPFLRAFFVLLCYFNSCCFKRWIRVRFFVERDLRAKRSRALKQEGMRSMEMYVTALRELFDSSGFAVLFSPAGTGNLVMIIVAFVLLYLAIGKGFEPLLLVPIAFSCLLVNLPLSGIMDLPTAENPSLEFLRAVYFGAQYEIYFTKCRGRPATVLPRPFPSPAGS